MLFTLWPWQYCQSATKKCRLRDLALFQFWILSSISTQIIRQKINKMGSLCTPVEFLADIVVFLLTAGRVKLNPRFRTKITTFDKKRSIVRIYTENHTKIFYPHKIKHGKVGEVKTLPFSFHGDGLEETQLQKPTTRLFSCNHSSTIPTDKQQTKSL